ncbi:MAG: ribosome silencing factor [Deltaproteobacteria bacterium]|nr:ribosome silencing factor [Deltaproteobacteria bacterium]
MSQTRVSSSGDVSESRRSKATSKASPPKAEVSSSAANQAKPPQTQNVASAEKPTRGFPRAKDLKTKVAKTSKSSLTGQALAELVAEAAREHKVVSPVILNLTGLSSVADWFYIASAENSRQVKAVAEKIVRRVREAGVRPLGQEGLSGSDSRWALLDLGDVVAHIFMPDTRSLYDLESLWSDAPRLSTKESPEAVSLI